MSEPKWTPGPWKPTGGVRGHYDIENGVYIAGTCGGLRDGVELANAQLMAAAPELYEALSHCMGELQVLRALKAHDRVQDRLVKKALKMANSAMDKAEGNA